MTLSPLDLKLLYSAAAASGYQSFQAHYAIAGPDHWNPLENSEQAFALAVRMRMTITISEEDQMTSASVPGAVQGYSVDFNNDAGAATRCAIVRAAAGELL